METTITQRPDTLVRPLVGQLVHIQFAPGHRCGGKVVEVDDDSFDVLKYTEWTDDVEVEFGEDDPGALFTLYDVEQSDPVLIVTVLD